MFKEKDKEELNNIFKHFFVAKNSSLALCELISTSYVTKYVFWF